MSKNPNQKLKLLYLYQILLQRTDENHKLTTDELRAALERCGITAERKSIYSDIEALQNFGLDVICQRGTGGGYYVASREFELPELKLLVDAIQCSRFITEKKSNELIGKIEHLTSDHEAHTLQRQVYVSERVKTLNEQIYYNIDALHAAISNDVQITFRYFNWVLNFSASPRIQKQYRRDGARYRISPWALTWDNENYYLIAFDHDAGEIRHYRVDKMDSLVQTDLPREGKQLFDDRFDAAAYSRKVFGMFSGEEKTVTGTESRRSLPPFSGSYSTVVCTVPDTSRRSFCGVWSLMTAVPYAHTIRPISGNVSGTIESALSVAAEICANFFS